MQFSRSAEHFFHNNALAGSRPNLGRSTDVAPITATSLANNRRRFHHLLTNEVEGGLQHVRILAPQLSNAYRLSRCRNGGGALRNSCAGGDDAVRQVRSRALK